MNPILYNFLQLLSRWMSETPLVIILLALMGIDVLAGIIVAVNKHTLNSSVSFKGMSKKVFMILLVGVATILQPLSGQNLPLANMTATCFVFTEAISILENAVALGIKLPRALVDVIQKGQESRQTKAEQKAPEATIKVPLSATDSTTITLPPSVPTQKTTPLK